MPVEEFDTPSSATFDAFLLKPQHVCAFPVKALWLVAAACCYKRRITSFLHLRLLAFKFIQSNESFRCGGTSLSDWWRRFVCLWVIGNCVCERVAERERRKSFQDVGQGLIEISFDEVSFELFGLSFSGSSCWNLRKCFIGFVIWIGSSRITKYFNFFLSIYGEFWCEKQWRVKPQFLRCFHFKSFNRGVDLFGVKAFRWGYVWNAFKYAVPNCIQQKNMHLFLRF